MSETVEQTESQLNSVSKTMCLAKWLQSSVLLQSGQSHSCHHPAPQTVPLKELAKDPAALHNSRYKKEMRGQMLNGLRPSECDYCWAVEDLKGRSDRVLKSNSDWAAPYLKEVLSKHSDANVNPRYLEVSFDFTCNFKCAYCSPRSSSLWYSEIEKHGPYRTSDYFNSFEGLRKSGMPITDKDNNPYVEAFWTWWPSIANDLRVFRITGGEPLLSKTTWMVLDYLADHPNPDLDLGLNSNMGVPRELVDKLIEKVSRLEGKIKSFTLFPSIDTLGARAEYIRFGMNEPLFWSNIEAFLNGVKWNVNMTFMITVSNLSLSGMPDLYKRLADLRARHLDKRIYIDPPYLRHPEFLSAKILPERYGIYLDQTVEFVKANIGPYPKFVKSDLSKIERVREWVQKKDVGEMDLSRKRRDFAVFVDEYDRRRKTDFAKTFPEYVDFLNECRG